MEQNPSQTAQLVKKFPTFIEPEGLVLHSQEPAICPYPDPDQPSPCLPNPFN